MNLAAWVNASKENREVDISWMTPHPEDVHPMFAPLPKHAPLPQSQEPPASHSAPQRPAGPSPEQLKIIAESEEIIRLLAGSLNELADASRREVGRVAEEIWEISLAVAEELAGGAIEADENRVIALIIQSLELLGVDRDIKVYLHPTVHDRLQSQGLLDDLRTRGGITLVPDPKITDVGCIIESPLGRIDARIHARLRQLRHLFAQKIGAPG